MPSPRVTIGMPVYNGERFLEEALDALLAQTFEDFELIVSDNASADRTEAICREYAARDSRVRYHRLDENQGAIRNFNRVFELARGEYFKWAAHDDICKPTLLEKCVAVLDSNPDVVWCHSQGGKIDEHGNVLTPNHPAAENLSHTREAGLPRKHFDSPRRHKRYRGVLLGTCWCADSWGLIRSEALRKTKLLPACFGAERVLIGALSLQGHYHEIPETLFYHRIHAGAAGSVDTPAGQARVMAPGQRTRAVSLRLMLLKGHIGAVMGTEMSVWDRARCLGVLAQYLFQIHKWKRVFIDTVTGKPLRGASEPRAAKKKDGERKLVGTT